MSLTGRHFPSDCQAVIDAASFLRVREVDVFRMAYRHQWDTVVDSHRLEKLFAAYMFHQQVPHWVTDFCEDVLNRHTGSELVPIRAEAFHYRRLSKPSRHGRLIVASVMAGLFVYTLLLTEMSYDPGTSAPIPCHRGAGFTLFSNLAHLVSGQVPPNCPTP